MIAVLNVSVLLECVHDIDQRAVEMALRADNGPELTARVLAEWCAAGQTATAYIDPGAPWQNAWVESLTPGSNR